MGETVYYIIGIRKATGETEVLTKYFRAEFNKFGAEAIYKKYTDVYEISSLYSNIVICESIYGG